MLLLWKTDCLVTDKAGIPVLTDWLMREVKFCYLQMFLQILSFLVSAEQQMKFGEISVKITNNFPHENLKSLILNLFEEGVREKLNPCRLKCYYKFII